MNGIVVLRVTRKGGKKQPIPLAEPTAVAVRRYVGSRGAGPLFLSRGGGRLAPEAANDLLRAVGRLVLPADEAEALHCHRVRHAWVSGCLDSGVALVDVQAAAGHMSPTTTARYDRERAAVSWNHPTFRLTRWLALDDP
jgi:integrase